MIDHEKYDGRVTVSVHENSSLVYILSYHTLEIGTCRVWSTCWSSELVISPPTAVRIGEEQRKQLV